MLLTALVFFNTYVWLMAANINGERLTLAMVFLLAIAGAFVVSKTVERVRPLLRSTTVMPQGSQSLAGTPFATMGDPLPASPHPGRTPQRGLPAGGLATRRDPGSGVGRRRDIPRSGHDHSHSAAASEWTHYDSMTTTVLGMTFPAPDSLIRMCLFLGALTFMYISARAVDDAEYRAMFLDPLIDDLHTALLARNRYRNNVVTAPCAGVDAGHVDD